MKIAKQASLISDYLVQGKYREVRCIVAAAFQRSRRRGRVLLAHVYRPITVDCETNVQPHHVHIMGER